MDYHVLAALIQTHPSWPSVDDNALAAWVNSGEIPASKPTVSSGELFAAILANLTEWTALAAADRELVRDILVIHAADGVPTAVGAPARAVLQAKLGTNTKAAIATLIATTLTRAENAGIAEVVKGGDIKYAREEFI